ncbi:MAG: hypothetical protein Solivirus4_16 [Solivirus sp.]|uniref:Uncharacterized protein n=1 Tax=Solivirus sp. TaxID=2487772 RepID=A0A3G5AFR2_9VIRU|nr:MAG: hypothetical protein Solivirus4_16 [Solivirus sp.]
MNLIKRSYKEKDFPYHTLNITSYDCKLDRYTLDFDCNYNNSIEILFCDINNNIFQFSSLVAGKRYYCCFLIKNKVYYLFRGFTSNSLFGFSTHKHGDGQIFIQLVPLSCNKKYNSESNLTGMFYYTGYPGFDPVVANFNRKASDVLSLVPKERNESFLKPSTLLESTLKQSTDMQIESSKRHFSSEIIQDSSSDSVEISRLKEGEISSTVYVESSSDSTSYSDEEYSCESSSNSILILNSSEFSTDHKNIR